jgi:hypothetical protein
MATYTAAQMYGTGSQGETITGATLFTFINPGPSSYFTFETIPNRTGSFVGKPTCAQGAWLPSTPYMGVISSSYVASAVVQPGTSSVYFNPSSSVAGTNYNFRGTGTFTMTTFNPSSSLFAAAEKGAWFDAGDLSTLFQDVAGTIPVTAVGQFVGKWLDKSGNAKHAVAAANNTTRPKYQIDDEGNPNVTFTRAATTQLVTPSIDFTGTAQMTVCAGLHVLESGSAGVALELGTSVATVNGTFSIGAPSSTADHSINLRGTSTVNARVANVVDGDDIITGLFDLSQATRVLQVIPRLNYIQIPDAQITWTGTTAGGGNFSNLPLYIGSEGASKTLPFGGKIYQIIVRGVLSTATQVYQIETFTDSKLD